MVGLDEIKGEDFNDEGSFLDGEFMREDRICFNRLILFNLVSLIIKLVFSFDK